MPSVSPNIKSLVGFLFPTTINISLILILESFFESYQLATFLLCSNLMLLMNTPFSGYVGHLKSQAVDLKHFPKHNSLNDITTLAVSFITTIYIFGGDAVVLILVSCIAIVQSRIVHHQAYNQLMGRYGLLAYVNTLERLLISVAIYFLLNQWPGYEVKVILAVILCASILKINLFPPVNYSEIKTDYFFISSKALFALATFSIYSLDKIILFDFVTSEEFITLQYITLVLTYSHLIFVTYFMPIIIQGKFHLSIWNMGYFMVVIGAGLFAVFLFKGVNSISLIIALSIYALGQKCNQLMSINILYNKFANTGLYTSGLILISIISVLIFYITESVQMYLISIGMLLLVFTFIKFYSLKSK